MSVPVALAELARRVDQYGPAAFVVTVGDDGAPHVVSVQVERRDGAVVVGAGRTTSRNASARPAVTVLWPPVPDGEAGYSLILDGSASLEGGQLVVAPLSAVLHRVADSHVDGPTCLPVLRD